MDEYALIGISVPDAAAQLWQMGYAITLHDVTGKKQKSSDMRLTVKIKLDADGKKADIFYSDFLLSVFDGE